AYAFLAAELVRELRELQGGEQLSSTLLEVGRRAGAAAGVRGAAALDRLGGVLALMEAQGADVDVVREEACTTIQGHSCPLASIVVEEPRACSFLQGFVAGALGAPVRQLCEHGSRPRCRFEVEMPRGDGVPPGRV
ncbi:MAG TPA: hypothetical protein VF832_21420, partial [Longimicrobiales bacterium]